MVTYLTRRGIYAIAMGDEAMQVLNLGRRARPAGRTLTSGHHQPSATGYQARIASAATPRWLFDSSLKRGRRQGAIGSADTDDAARRLTRTPACPMPSNCADTLARR